MVWAIRFVGKEVYFAEEFALVVGELANHFDNEDSGEGIEGLRWTVLSIATLNKDGAFS